MTEREAIAELRRRAYRTTCYGNKVLEHEENLVAIEALEKQIAKKPIRNDKCTCPSCETYNEVFNRRRNTVAHDIVYCWHCGQALEINRLEL